MNRRNSVVLGLLAAIAAVHWRTAEPRLFDCVYSPLGGEPTQFHDCVALDHRGVPVMVPEHLRRMEFGSNGLSWLFILDAEGHHQDFFYISKDGRVARVLRFDNGPDDFRHGLARTKQGGKVGFVNQALEIVIPATYDFAFPFDQGLAAVCDDCYAVPDRTGEHQEIVGGRWGYINTAGEIVVPLTRERDFLPSIDQIRQADDQK